VRRALLLKGIDFQLREPNGPEDYRRWSPDTGLLPVLEIDGQRTADSTDILFRLDALYPNPPLLADDPKLAVMQRQLEDWADESFLWYFIAFSRGRESADASEGASGGRRETRLPHFLRSALAWLRSGGTWERPETALMRGLGDRLDDLVKFLGGRAFFYADRISVADLGVYGMLYTMRLDSIAGSAKMLEERPALGEFMRRVERQTGG
jgi:glutathione S-transferase